MKKTYNAYKLRTLTQYMAEDTEHRIATYAVGYSGIEYARVTAIPCPCGDKVTLNRKNEYRSTCQCGRTYRWIEVIEVTEP